MKTFLKALGITLLVAIIAAAAMFVLYGSETLPLNGVIDKVANTTTNAAIDVTGVKERVDSALRENAGRIAEKTGLPESQIEGIIDDLDVRSWEATSLPDDAVAQGSAQLSYGGLSGIITTYDDPSVITVDAGAGAVTLKIPSSAQGYIGFLEFL